MKTILRAKLIEVLSMVRHADPKVEKRLQAAERGDLAAIIDFLDSGIDVNAGNSIGASIGRLGKLG